MSRIAEGGVFGALLRGADETPDDVFFSLRSEQVELSFATLKERIAAGAVELRAHGVKPGDVVLIIAQHGLGKLQGFFGAQLLGAIPAFMPPPTPRQPLDTWATSHRALLRRTRPR